MTSLSHVDYYDQDEPKAMPAKAIQELPSEDCQSDNTELLLLDEPFSNYLNIS